MTKKWWKAALIRAVRTVAQAAVSLISVGAVMSDIDWLRVASASLLAGILSLLTSVAGLPEVDEAERADDNEACYVQMAKEANELREAIDMVDNFENFDQEEAE